MAGDEPKTRYMRNDAERAVVMQVISKLELSADQPYAVTIKIADESRSDKQNRLAFSWYQIMGAMTGHGKEHERAYCKLTYGIPILRRDDAEFNQFYNQALMHLTYEQQLKAMEYLSVTSLMGVRQFAEYLTTVDNEAGLRGIRLPHPEDSYYEALMVEMSR